ncbi:MAG TPA: NmrA/HSCARG family protein, partial [Candidatus Eisenbacteria bacterium]
MSRTILVTGATGAQGGSVAHALLTHGGFNVRALTRHPDSDKARALKAAGAVPVAGDLADRASLEAALAGCSACFGVTNFWEHFEAEFDHGKNLIEAVAAAGIRDFLYSSLPPIEKSTDGKLKAPHFDLKAELETLARRLVPGSAFVHLMFYYENFLAGSAPQRTPDGSYAFGFPQGDVPLAGVSAEDVGGAIAPIFADFDAWRGKAIPIVGDILPPAEYAAILSRVTGARVLYSHIPLEVFSKFPFPGADDLANMFEWYRLYMPDRHAAW